MSGKLRQSTLEEAPPSTPSLTGGFHREVLQVPEPAVSSVDHVANDEPRQPLAQFLAPGVLEDEECRGAEEALKTPEVPGTVESPLLDADNREQVRPFDRPERRPIRGLTLAHTSTDGCRYQEYHGGPTEKDLAGRHGRSPMFESGAFVADHLGDLDPEQVQPNGVDLRLGAVLEWTGSGRITRSGKTVGDREPLATVPLDGDPDRQAYRLDPGGYVLEYAEPVTIPDGHVGFVLPRSSLMRNGAMLNTAVWDAGYSGRGEGLLQVHNPLTLEEGARVAQLVLATADHEDRYDGAYQGERLE